MTKKKDRGYTPILFYNCAEFSRRNRQELSLQALFEFLALFNFRRQLRFQLLVLGILGETLILLLQIPFLTAEHLLAPHQRDALADLKPQIFV